MKILRQIPCPTFCRILCLALLALPAAGRAQISVYVTYTATSFHFNSGLCDAAGNLCGEALAAARPNNAESNAGIGAGATLNLPSQNRLKAGLDLRGSYNHGTPGGSTFSGGAQLTFIPERHRLSPFVRAGAGYVSANTDSILPCFCFSGDSPKGPPNFSASGGFFTVDGGLDLRLTPSAGLRLIDVGYSPLKGNPTGTAVNVVPNFTLSAGFVFTIPYRSGKSSPSP